MPYIVGGHTKIMKQTLNTHACSLVRKEVAVFSLARGKAATVTRENGEAAGCSLAQEGRRQHVGSH